MKALFGIWVFCPLFAYASIIAIVDTGTDITHKDIAPQVWLNPVDDTKNGVDEDGNGFTDDIHGWNFAEDNNMVIDRKYLGRLTPDIRRFFEIQDRASRGIASKEDIAWAKKKLEDNQFAREIGTYANFMHGTHVAGIAIKQNADARLFAVKLIPNLSGLASRKRLGEELWRAKQSADSTAVVLKKLLKSMAKQKVDSLMQAATYLNGHRADVANFSFGISYAYSRVLVEGIAKFLEEENALTEAQIDEITRSYLGELLEKGKDVVRAAPDTLFVMGAGNEGADNDRYPHALSNVREPNTIAVAASLGTRALAGFSNYGATTVDVAAPGVGINSTVPGDKYLPVSGTSQATPYVSGVASAIKDANPALTPADMKKVIMGTVDKKDFLTGKVKSGGVVNPTRALHAAELSLMMPLSEAISAANLEIITLKPNFLGFDGLEAPEVSEEAADLVMSLRRDFGPLDKVRLFFSP